MKRIALVNSTASATVDDGDYEKLIGSAWRLNRQTMKRGVQFYACRTTSSGKESMANAILGPPPAGMVWDHHNGNGLDNRRANLRPATREENSRNSRKKRSPTSSRFKGVRKHKRRWYASIWVGGRGIHLGSFTDEREAAAAYDQAARYHFGEFACANFPRRAKERGCLI
jgi:hypothetical protein